MMFTRRLKFLIFNILGLQITWAACAYGATHAWPLLGVWIGLVYIGLHFLLVEERLRDLKVVLIIGMVGILLDVLNAWLGILSFSSDGSIAIFLPYWLMVLWFVFSLMVPHSLFWLEKNLVVASIAGGIGGGGSYLLGHILGAITLSQPTTVSFLIYFVEWSLFFPISLKVVKVLATTKFLATTKYFV
ncbi:MAG: DUF2878 domain-containing protein [Gammaproteobacteria bacterium]